jgi:hypothetical protein
MKRKVILIYFEGFFFRHGNTNFSRGNIKIFDRIHCTAGNGDGSDVETA